MTRAKKNSSRVLGPIHTITERWFGESELQSAQALLTKDDAQPEVRGHKGLDTVVCVEDVWATVLLDGYWGAACRVVSDESGRPVIGEIRVYPLEQEWAMGEWLAAVLGHRAKVARGGLSASVLRKITARSILEALQRQVQGTKASGAKLAIPSGEWLSDHWDREAVTKAPGTRRGRPRRPVIDYALLAEQYVALRKAGHRKPIPTLAEQRGETIPTVRAALHRARLRGLMPLGKKGAALGQLTPKAKRLLRRSRDETNSP